MIGLIPVLAVGQDITAEPTYGSLALEEGFYPDPQYVDVTSGGSIAVGIPGCDFGFVAETPDVDLYYTTTGESDLYFYVEGEGDTTLLINTPTGDWVCDDDGGPGTNPSVRMRFAPEGLYNVWVGSYSDEFTDATLYISEIGTVDRPDAIAFVPNAALEPTYGSVTLDEGFLPDPYILEVSAGGEIPLDMGECTYGYVAEAPDFDVYYNSTGSSTLYIYVESDEDTTLLVNTPIGDWICNDDGYYAGNPLIVLPASTSGLFDIWVGTYSGNFAEADLYISEIDPR